ncbi:uncharacterized protein LOC127260090 [Andrographis paniculata]|uniref:uncharacterized protein LOC127260090 n=1 Tax=Andrographis paniculata TaxID=175694 RepID=UPI0021E96A22|nr:uncharacterized protein LOC127260090 [Andrographis paniculata]
MEEQEPLEAAAAAAEDPFGAIVQFCLPTASQMAYFRTCPFHSDSDVFQDPDPFPGSQTSADRQTEDNAVFHTPPEHHLHSNLSSSEDQNPVELCAEVARAVGSCRGADGSKEVSGFDGEPEPKKVRVPREEFGGKATPVKEIVNEVRRSEAVGDEIIDLGSDDSDEEAMAVDRRDTPEEARVKNDVRKSIGLKKPDASAIDACDKNHQSRSKCEEPKDIRVDKIDRNFVSSEISESMSNSEAEDQITNRKCPVEAKSREVADASGDGKLSKDGCVDEGRRTAFMRIQDIDMFRFSGWEEAGRKRKGIERNASIPSKRQQRELPASMKDLLQNEGRANVVGEEPTNEWRRIQKDREGGIQLKNGELNEGKETNEEGSNVARMVEKKKKGGLMEISGILKKIVRNLNTDGGSGGEVDFLETAKKRGVTFPRPRWWPRSWD